PRRRRRRGARHRRGDARHDHRGLRGLGRARVPGCDLPFDHPGLRRGAGGEPASHPGAGDAGPGGLQGDRLPGHLPLRDRDRGRGAAAGTGRPRRARDQPCPGSGGRGRGVHHPGLRPHQQQGRAADLTPRSGSEGAGAVLDWTAVTSTPPSRAPRRIVLLTGPSGSGKGMVARRSGVPALNLDDFYRAGDDPSLPRRFGIPDWDLPASWDDGAALAALTALAHDGAAEIPTYSIAQSRRTGSTRLEIGDAPVLIAEGIFAAELIAPLAAAGLLADAIVLDRPVPVVFVLRLVRDLREHRKSVPILLQLGTALARQQGRDMTRWKRAGLRPYGLRAAVHRLRE